MLASPEEFWGSHGHAPKPRDDSASTAEPDAVGGVRRIVAGIHREDTGEPLTMT